METERDRYQRCLIELAVGDALEDVSSAMVELARSLPPSQLAQKAYSLYEKFRPEIPPGKKGWGASGKLDLDLIRKMRLRGRRGKCKLVVPSNSLVPQFACNKNLLVCVTYEVTIEL